MTTPLRKVLEERMKGNERDCIFCNGTDKLKRLEQVNNPKGKVPKPKFVRLYKKRLEDK